jgi:hypothetical protein
VISVKGRRPARRASTEEVEIQVFPCGDCGKVFESITLLVRHVSAKHIRSSDRMMVDVEIETETW